MENGTNEVCVTKLSGKDISHDGGSLRSKKDEYVVSTFYLLVDIQKTIQKIKEELVSICAECKMKGTILLAHEGINATISSDRASMDLFYERIGKMDYFSEIRFQETFCHFIPFSKMKIRYKKEVVRLKNSDLIRLSQKQVGTHLNSDEWDALIKNDNVLLIDTRNYYEVTMGTFKGAINPEVEHFSDLRGWLTEHLSDVPYNKKIAMFCTGGIRCEKSTAHVKKMGFSNVYHLNGGIIQYMSDRVNKPSLWKGLLFLFDDRIAIDSSMRSLM